MIVQHINPQKRCGKSWTQLIDLHIQALTHVREGTPWYGFGTIASVAFPLQNREESRDKGVNICNARWLLCPAVLRSAKRRHKQS